MNPEEAIRVLKLYADPQTEEDKAQCDDAAEYLLAKIHQLSGACDIAREEADAAHRNLRAISSNIDATEDHMRHYKMIIRMLHDREVV